MIIEPDSVIFLYFSLLFLFFSFLSFLFFSFFSFLFFSYLMDAVIFLECCSELKLYI